MEQQLGGIHHVTAIAADPQRNLDFYTQVLGLRLVKLTVNFDDPGTYHFYFGNEEGEPGTILTFFPWPDARRGRIGAGQVSATAFSIPENSIGHWTERLARHRVEVGSAFERFEETVIPFADRDGLALELVASSEDDSRVPWANGPLEPDHAIRGCHAVTITGRRCEQTQAALADIGFRLSAESGNRLRFTTGDGGPGTYLDLLCQRDAAAGLVAVGTVHHVAWRTPSNAEQEHWRQRIAELDLSVTRVLDRHYFRSIYFREPGGTLFEIATDQPGFLVDESLDELGTRLRLPEWIEPRRLEIERVLPALRL
ncbi:MAG: ring-cleaving dioxygenase [Gemmatimonadota bacterium]|nr:MAG: ring-cleaving dioxygenase [Gemmatimonadota bacterium]